MARPAAMHLSSAPMPVPMAALRIAIALRFPQTPRLSRVARISSSSDGTIVRLTSRRRHAQRSLLQVQDRHLNRRLRRSQLRSPHQSRPQNPLQHQLQNLCQVPHRFPLRSPLPAPCPFLTLHPAHRPCHRSPCPVLSPLQLQVQRGTAATTVLEAATRARASLRTCTAWLRRSSAKAPAVGSGALVTTRA